VTQDSLFLVFDLVGTCAFAMSGAFKAIRKSLDLLGILVLGFATAMGGGVVRDALLHRTPVAFTTNLYALFALIGCLLGMRLALCREGEKVSGRRPGLSSRGRARAGRLRGDRRLGGIRCGARAVSVVVLAALTGAGGGALRDLLVLEIPMILHADFYATAALLGGLSFVLIAGAGFHTPVASAAAFLTTLPAAYRGDLPRLEPAQTTVGAP